MKQEHQRIRELVKELGEKQFNDHTRPIRYTKGYDDILEYIEQQEIIERALTDTTLEIVNETKSAIIEALEDYESGSDFDGYWALEDMKRIIKEAEGK